MAMASFNELLTGAGVDVRKTKLVRHQQGKAGPYWLWAAQDGRFELYQRIQSKPRFRDAEWIASFVATPEGETLFVGAYRNLGVGRPPAGLRDPLGGHDVSHYYFYDLAVVPGLTQYAGRLVVDWGEGYRAWVQQAQKHDKPILEVSRSPRSVSKEEADRALAARVRASDDNADWTWDEHVLALALYRQNPASPPGKNSAEINALSTLLNRLAERRGIVRSETFRNANGVYMKLMNFRRLDPEFRAAGKVGLSRGAKGEAEVWNEFSHNRSKLDQAAAAIRLAIEDEAVDLRTSPDDYEAEEGSPILRLHRSRERDRELVRRKKRQALAENRHLSCEVCEFNFGERYGELGQDFIEVHHRKPVHTLQLGDRTRLNDLALVCANCHRMLHRSRRVIDVSELRVVIGAPKAAR
jgi:5-methylcytosine-specific restriction enzyme A